MPGFIAPVVAKKEAPAWVLNPPAPKTAAPPSSGWFGPAAAIGGGAVLVLALGGVAGVILLRKRGTGKASAAVDKPAKVSFPCECGKKLKVKAAAAGKTIKCPHCAKAVVVPSADAIQADQASS